MITKMVCGLYVCQVISGHRWPVFCVLHVANRSRRHSDGADNVDTSINGSYVISADTTDRHISVWLVTSLVIRLYHTFFRVFRLFCGRNGSKGRTCKIFQCNSPKCWLT